jgi:hypothetical protein
MKRIYDEIGALERGPWMDREKWQLRMKLKTSMPLKTGGLYGPIVASLSKRSA